jgi:cell division protease FtsH
MGAERKSLILTEKEREIVAYHEAGHALVAVQSEDTDPLEKVTIVPRGRSLGTTWQLPTDERYNRGKRYFEARIAVAMGGRVAEELVFGDITEGAKGDIMMATGLARAMVCEWGMSERLGPIALGRQDEEVFLGREITQHRHISEETAEAIDEEIRALVETGKKRAHDLLAQNRDLLDSVAMALLERETLDDEEVQLLIQGSPLPAPRRDPDKSENGGAKPKETSGTGPASALGGGEPATG